MSKTQPIKDEEMLKKFRNYYRDIEPNPRNYALIVFGLNSALRISDILGLCWNDVYSDQNHRYREHIAVWEQKTGKENILIVNQHAKEALEYYRKTLLHYHKNDYNHKCDYICTIVLKLETLLSQMKKSRKQKFQPFL